MSAKEDYPYLASLPNVAGYGEGTKALDEIDQLRAKVAKRLELYEEVRHAYRMGWMQDDSDRPLKILAALRGEEWPG